LGHRYDIERASDLHMEWCRALMKRADLGTSHRAAPQMRAVMHELRSALLPSSVLAIANALPTLERGIFLEDWHLDYSPVSVESVVAFEARVYQRVKNHHARVHTIVEDVFWVWNEMLEPAKAQIIRQNLPSLLEQLWPDQSAGSSGS